MTIAGSDCSAGAGLQADLKTFEAMGVYGLTIASALTAQNTKSVLEVHPVPDSFITAQFECLFSDFEVAALKTGMMTSTDMIDCVAENIAAHASGIPFVIDPVISATTGTEFMGDNALQALKSRLIPMASLITPNLHEAARLLKSDTARNVDDMISQARALKDTLNPGAVLIKGGHLEASAEATDILFDGRDIHQFASPFIKTENTHGTGCTLSAAITSGLADGAPLNEAVSRAKGFITNALHGSAQWNIGSGNGPLKHRGS